MSEDLQSKIVEHLKSGQYRPTRARGLAGELNLKGEDAYPEFRRALKELMNQGKVVVGPGGTVVLPGPKEESRRRHHRGLFTEEGRIRICRGARAGGA